MKPNLALDRSVLQAELEAEQRQTEGIMYSVGFHILFFVLALNFKSIEKFLNLESVKQIKKVEQNIEVSLVDQETQSIASAAAQMNQMKSLSSNVATVPDIKDISENSQVESVEKLNDLKTLSQRDPSLMSLPVDTKGEITQLTEKSRTTAKISQAQVQLQLMRERQKEMQQQIDNSLIEKNREVLAEKIQQQGISNLVDNEGGVSLVEEETPERPVAYTAPVEGDPQTGSSDFVVNIQQHGVGFNQQPCPDDRTYHNPGNECKAYTQKLYKPLCLYEYNECLVQMKKFKLRMGASVK